MASGLVVKHRSMNYATPRMTPVSEGMVLWTWEGGPHVRIDADIWGDFQQMCPWPLTDVYYDGTAYIARRASHKGHIVELDGVIHYPMPEQQE